MVFGDIYLVNFDPALGREYKKVRQISSFDKKRFVKFIGKADSPVVRGIRGYLRKHFGL